MYSVLIYCSINHLYGLYMFVYLFVRLPSMTNMFKMAGGGSFTKKKGKCSGGNQRGEEEGLEECGVGLLVIREVRRKD